MPSIERDLAPDVITFRLEEEGRNMRESQRRETGPTSRTLIKNGPLSLTLISLPAGGTIKEHQAKGPITVHVLNGSLTFHAADAAHRLSAGDLLCLSPNIQHSVESDEGATMLLTIASAG